ncbi:MAG: hydrolase TatD [Bacteroidetes bacterium]|nr:MAG: hydrolase TatD [Bacteroidota bacterium]
MHTFIDTHAHLYLSQFDEDGDAVVDSALQQDVKKILLPNIDNSTVRQMLDMEEKYEGVCYAMMGLHPCSVDANYRDQLKMMEEWLEKRQFLAVGEIGTDLFWDKTFKDEQEACFRAQVGWARERGLPVVIHSRETLDWNISIIEEEQDGALKGIFHCFNGTVEQAERITGMGFYMGLGGVVTFKNSGMSEIVPHIDPNYCVLETDAPYLTPVPHRGKRNESSYIPLVAKRVAEYWNMTVEQVADITTENAVRVFGPDIMP